MKNTSQELAAVQQATPVPRETRAEYEARLFREDMDRVAREFNKTPKHILLERSAAVLALIVKPADAEAVRAAYWNKLPVAARMVALMAANLPKERAKEPLMKLNALERGQVWLAVDKLRAELDMLQKCMNGGTMPAATGKVH